jgi:4'-phosphopantetheinyl transferase
MPTKVDCLAWTDNVPTTLLTDLLSANGFSSNVERPLTECRRWFVPLSDIDTQLDACEQFLTDSERERADRFRHEGARKQFIVGHAAIHLLLKQYLGNEYKSIQWKESEHHKPFIQLADSSIPLEYNLSHCEGFIAVAFGTISQGIDIEQIRHLNDLEGISRQVFTEKELAEVFDTNDTEIQNQTFFKFWSCKEAALKAHGTGFMKDPKSLELHFKPKAEPTDKPVFWSDSIPGYSAAWTERA